jgi:hypothetical protein
MQTVKMNKQAGAAGAAAAGAAAGAAPAAEKILHRGTPHENLHSL